MLSPLGGLALAMWADGVCRQVRRGREYERQELVWNEREHARKAETVHFVEYVLSLIDVEVLLRAWGVGRPLWPQLIDWWERMLPASFREDWTRDDVWRLEASLKD
ncbi:MAG: hypothetical protein A2Y78_12860 [Acidobacteria bacterium RBG_13_68_16]|nr:MAG: hypothetical protein A2Y78_12860 [Acidobacteria bacterium RBG_13_68_16]